MNPGPDLDPISARLRSEEARLRRRITWLTLIPIAVAALLIWFTGSQVSSAQKELAALQDSLGQIELTLDSAQAELIIRLETLARKRQEADSLQSLVRTYMDWIERRNSAVAARIQDQAIETYQAEQIKPRIYLHILQEEQRAGARRAEAFLEEAGFVVPGIERVSSGPSTSELRFFRADDEAMARQIQLIARRQGVRLKLRDLSARYGDSKSIRSGHFEIWFGEDFAP